MYKLKNNQVEDETMRIFRAKFVIRGFTQEKILEHNKVFSLVARYGIIHLICAMVAIFILVMDHMDVITNFLYGNLET